MKELLKTKFLCLFGLVILLSACGKDDDGLGVEAGSGKITVKIDGADWESKDEIDGAVYGSSQGTNTIQGYATDDSYFGLTFFGTPSSGLTLGTADGMFQAQYKPAFMGSELYSAVGGLGSGTITITTFNASKIAGTFQFTGAKPNSDGTLDEKVFSSGTFDIDL